MNCSRKSALTLMQDTHIHAHEHTLSKTHTHIQTHSYAFANRHKKRQPRCHFRFRCTRVDRCVERACVCGRGSPVDNPAVNCSQLYGKLYKSQLAAWNMIKQSVSLWEHPLKRSKRITLKQKHLKLTLPNNPKEMTI